MTRKGKIARLPVQIREELNRRLENGEAGVRLVEWLNGLPEVMAVLQKDFEGVAISEMNLSQWKNGGFVDWQARRKAQSMMEEWRIEDGKSTVLSPSSDYGATSSPESGEVRAAMTERLMVHYAAALEDALAEGDEKPRNRVERLGRSLKDMSRLRRDELARERLREQVRIDDEWVAIERERLALERERLELQRVKVNKQPEGVESNKEEALSHEEKAEMVKEMVREAREKLKQ